MKNNPVKGSIVINAPAAKIWDTLTNPDKIVQYPGSRVNTDWTPDSPITREGEMHGVKLKNKGKVLEKVMDKLLRFTYWSGMGGDPDLAENYSEITYNIDQLAGGKARLTYLRLKIPTKMERQMFEAHVPAMLEEIKKLAEHS